MARSKRLDSTGQSNDNRSIALENIGEDDISWQYEADDDRDHMYRNSVANKAFDPKSDHLTHKIELPEHLKRLYG